MKQINEKADTYKDKRVRHSFLSFGSFLQFFALASFIVTCCIIMFIHLSDINITINSENVKMAALYTFGDVLFFGVVFAVFDNIRHAITIGRPINRLLKGTSCIINGDFSVQVKPIHKKNKNEFDILIDDFNKMAQELEGIETLRNDFIANVSHELKTPLSIIQNYATILQSPDIEPEKRQEYIKSIADVSGRMTSLITNILNLSKLENQQIYPNAKKYDLSEQICLCLIGFESIWEKKNIDIETDIDDSVYITADEELMLLVWNNLFSNAFKFTPENGKVSVSVKENADSVFVSISDTGCGMSDEVISHIFEKFYQGDKSHSVQGNGLGLCIVKRVIDIVGGKISVESETGKGSNFYIVFKKS